LGAVGDAKSLSSTLGAMGLMWSESVVLTRNLRPTFERIHRRCMSLATVLRLTWVFR